MTRLPALIDAFAACDERDRGTIEHFARVIREAGHLPTTKRGVGAAEMGPTEAAMLMIAINASDAPRSAPEAVQAFRQLPWTPHPHEKEDDPVAELLEGRPFGDALTTLLQHLPTLIEELLSPGNHRDAAVRSLNNPQWLKVRFERPFRNAFIFLRHSTRTFSGRWGTWDDEYDETRLFRLSMVEIWSPTLLTISRVLAPEQWARLPPELSRNAEDRTR